MPVPTIIEKSVRTRVMGIMLAGPLITGYRIEYRKVTSIQEHLF